MKLQQSQQLLFVLALAGLSMTSAWEFPFHTRTLQANVTDVAVVAPVVPVDDGTTPSPTSSPTESPAPSPSPSSQPTFKPTVSPAPTADPTSAPTESPAPSPSPSSQPTFHPTGEPSVPPSSEPTKTPEPTSAPSNLPSSSPSVLPSTSPSLMPSVSLQPSLQPSVSPSGVPSESPSTSIAPSLAPSAQPSVSMQPSLQPTHVDSLTASFRVELGLTTKLNTTQVAAFETATADFIAMQAFLSDTVVTVTSQTLLTSRRSRRLQTTSANAAVTGLEIGFDVDTVYTGPDKSMDLFTVLDPSFQGLESTWLQMVAGSGDVFETLRPSFNPVQFAVSADGRVGDGGSKSNNNGAGVGAFGTAMVVIVAVAAVLMGVMASVFAVRTHQVAVYGEELASPPKQSASRFCHEFVATPTDSVDDGSEGRKSAASSIASPSVTSPYSGNDDGLELTTSGNLLRTMSNFSCASGDADKQVSSPVSPNTLERGSSGAACGGATNLFDNGVFRKSDRNSQDPPTYTQYRAKESLFDNESQTEFSGDSRFMGSAADAFMSGNNTSSRARAAGVYNNQNIAPPTSNYPPQHPASKQGQNNTKESTNGPGYSEASHELKLTKSMGGTLGASAVGGYADSQASDFSSQAKSFFSSILGGTQQPTTAPAPNRRVPATNGIYNGSKPSSLYSNSNASGSGNGNLGARALGNNSDHHAQLNQKSSYESVLRRAGLYDVFAPAGPIGIVVDTSKEGPAVHSLKSTSPMLGLINAGDLIVGLDDQDTRSMTAATLTRLMAKKSNQKERKITLLAGETYY